MNQYLPAILNQPEYEEPALVLAALLGRQRKFSALSHQFIPTLVVTMVLASAGVALAVVRWISTSAQGQAPVHATLTFVLLLVALAMLAATLGILVYLLRGRRDVPAAVVRGYWRLCLVPYEGGKMLVWDTAPTTGKEVHLPVVDAAECQRLAFDLPICSGAFADELRLVKSLDALRTQASSFRSLSRPAAWLNPSEEPGKTLAARLRQRDSSKVRDLGKVRVLEAQPAALEDLVTHLRHLRRVLTAPQKVQMQELVTQVTERVKLALAAQGQNAGRPGNVADAEPAPSLPDSGTLDQDIESLYAAMLNDLAQEPSKEIETYDKQEADTLAQVQRSFAYQRSDLLHQYAMKKIETESKLQPLLVQQQTQAVNAPAKGSHPGTFERAEDGSSGLSNRILGFQQELVLLKTHHDQALEHLSADEEKDVGRNKEHYNSLRARTVAHVESLRQQQAATTQWLRRCLEDARRVPKADLTQEGQVLGYRRKALEALRDDIIAAAKTRVTRLEAARRAIDAHLWDAANLPDVQGDLYVPIWFGRSGAKGKWRVLCTLSEWTPGEPKTTEGVRFTLNDGRYRAIGSYLDRVLDRPTVERVLATAKPPADKRVGEIKDSLQRMEKDGLLSPDLRRYLEANLHVLRE